MKDWIVATIVTCVVILFVITFIYLLVTYWQFGVGLLVLLFIAFVNEVRKQIADYNG